jgi:hypothetical protein
MVNAEEIKWLTDQRERTGRAPDMSGRVGTAPGTLGIDWLPRLPPLARPLRGIVRKRRRVTKSYTFTHRTAMPVEA